jgi:SAM-dependent methyltransferase
MAHSHQRDYPGDLTEMVSWVDSVATPGQRVLDIGCGDGSLVEALAGRYRVLGVDPHAEAGAHVDTVAFETLEAEPFDVVVASLSLHHLPDVGAASAALRRLTAPGGTVLIREFDRTLMADRPTLQWWFHQRQALDVVEPPDPEDHPLPATFDEFRSGLLAMFEAHILTWEAVESMLLAAGLSPISCRPAPHLFRWGLTEAVRPLEEALIDAGRIRAVGLRWQGCRAA